MRNQLIFLLLIFSFLFLESCTYTIKEKRILNGVTEKVNWHTIDDNDKIIWENPEPCPDSILPKEEEFVKVDKEPFVELDELENKLVYPLEAKTSNIQGKVIIRVLVKSKGKIQKMITQTSPSQVLTKAAMDAIRKCDFKPAILKSKPIPCWATIPIAFKFRW